MTHHHPQHRRRRPNQRTTHTHFAFSLLNLSTIRPSISHLDLVDILLSSALRSFKFDPLLVQHLHPLPSSSSAMSSHNAPYIYVTPTHLWNDTSLSIGCRHLSSAWSLNYAGSGSPPLHDTLVSRERFLGSRKSPYLQDIRNGPIHVSSSSPLTPAIDLNPSFSSIA
ncbi:hypothetical protein BDN70DRAFT_884437 [Pholiota conissans]|uniref:Uncharacterized protein n=1 Tax=Pholiota conissans TaxID=109636 RepID=A0A9P5YTE0_9AGAR|nr:hypothetical protein BDN70DRAFT_884437 [Pholiota conissans]